MTEPKLTEELAEETPRSPYELWPDETAPFENATPQAPEPPAVEPVIFQQENPSPFADPFAPQPQNEAEVKFDAPFEAPFIPVAYTPETTEHGVRNSGLAWSAGVVFFGAVAFMLFLGWLADLLLGSSPYGIVVGIVLGAIIGFIQFFRISSQIFSGPKSDPDHRPLLSRHDDE